MDNVWVVLEWTQDTFFFIADSRESAEKKLLCEGWEEEGDLKFSKRSRNDMVYLMEVDIYKSLTLKEIARLPHGHPEKEAVRLQSKRELQ